MLGSGDCDKAICSIPGHHSHRAERYQGSCAEGIHDTLMGIGNRVERAALCDGAKGKRVPKQRQQTGVTSAHATSAAPARNTYVCACLYLHVSWP